MGSLICDPGLKSTQENCVLRHWICGAGATAVYQARRTRVFAAEQMISFQVQFLIKISFQNYIEICSHLEPFVAYFEIYLESFLP